MRVTFATRQDAGRRLASRLRELAVEVDLVVGLPRGGVVVAAEVAAALQRPLEVIVVRKIGHPWYREYAVGALAEEDVVILDRDLIAAAEPTAEEFGHVIAEEKQRLHDYCQRFTPSTHQSFAGLRVLVVDDGLATGATAEAAICAAHRKRARQVILAVPVASTSACERLERVADRVITLLTDPDFATVGQYYEHFDQTDDAEVLALLHAHAGHPQPGWELHRSNPPFSSAEGRR